MQFITRKKIPTSTLLCDIAESTEHYDINGSEQIYQIEVTGNYLIILKDKSLHKNRESLQQQIVVYQLRQKTLRSYVLTSGINITKFWMFGRTEIAFFVNLTSKVKFYIFSLKTNSLLNVLTFHRQGRDKIHSQIDSKQIGNQNKYFVFQSLHYICIIYPKTNTSSTIKVYSVEPEKYQQSTLIFQKEVEVEIKKIHVMQQSSTIYYANINEDLLCQIKLLEVAKNHVVQNYYQFDLKSWVGGARILGLQINSIEQVNQKEFFIHLNLTLFNFHIFPSFLVVANKRTQQVRLLQKQYPDSSYCYIMMSHTSQLSFVMNMVFNKQFEDQSQLVYIDRCTGQIIKKWVFDQSRYILNNFSTSEHALSLILTDNKFQNMNLDTYKLESKRQLIVKHFYTPKLQYLHWLLQENQDFDDDLLQEAIQLLQADSQSKPLFVYEFRPDYL